MGFSQVANKSVGGLTTSNDLIEYFEEKYSGAEVRRDSHGNWFMVNRGFYVIRDILEVAIDSKMKILGFSAMIESSNPCPSNPNRYKEFRAYIPLGL